ncbi:zinc carboxypeptidase [Halomonas phage YPHTV-1]|nr:zinc carboxypeptidase [Halomonas phage YPHTV-1]
MPIKPVSGKIKSQEINDNLSYLDSSKRDNKKLIDFPDLAQEVKEGMTGGSVPVVGKDSVDTINMRDGAATPEKTTFMVPSRNLFNGGYIKNTMEGASNSLWISRNSSHGADAGSLAIIKVKPNTTYTIKSHDVALTDAFRIGVSDGEPVYDGAGRFYLDTTIGVMGDNSVPNREYTLTSGANTNFLYVLVSIQSNEPKLQVEEGSVATEFTPPFKLKDEYIQKEPKLSVGSVFNENIRDKAITPEKTSFFLEDNNIFDGNYNPWVLRKLADGSMRVDKVLAGETGGLAIIPVSPNTTYTVKSHDPDITNVFRIGLSNRPFEFSAYDIYNLDTAVHDGDVSNPQHTFTTGTESMLAFIYVSTAAQEPRLKLEEGSKATEYIGIHIDPKYISETNSGSVEVAKKVSPLRSKNMYSVPALESVNKPDSTYKIHDQTSTSMYTLYDALVTKYPTYITKELVTNEKSGQPIYKYVFKPEQPAIERINKETDLLHFFVVSGVHGSEKAGWWCLYESMKQICENWRTSEVLETLRWDIKFTVIPIVNVYGVDNPDDPVTFNGKINANGVDINRNFPEGFTVGAPGSIGYGGSNPLSEPETIAIANILENEGVDFYADFHNFSSQPDPNIFLWNILDDMHGIDISQNYLTHLSYKWKAQDPLFPQDDGVFFGYSSIGAGGSSPPFVNSLGITGGIFEISHTMHPKGDSSQYSSEVVTLGAEAQLNWLYMGFRNLTN